MDDPRRFATMSLVVVLILFFAMLAVVKYVLPKASGEALFLLAAQLGSIGAILAGLYLLLVRSIAEEIPGAILVAGGVVGMTVLASGGQSKRGTQAPTERDSNSFD